MNPEKRRAAEAEGLHKFFKLQTTVSLSSMCVFDENCCMRKFESVELIMKEFFKVRLAYYEKRKKYHEGMLQAESRRLSNQARFIIEKCDGTLVIENKKMKVMIEELKRNGYDPDPVAVWKMKQNKAEALMENEDAEGSQLDDGSDVGGGYNYLLAMALYTLTEEKKEDLLRKRDDKLTQLKILQTKSPAALWKEDLDVFLEQLDKVEAKEKEDELGVSSGKTTKVGKKFGGSKKKEMLTAAETKPSPQGRRVIPKIDVKLKEKFEKETLSKENKGKRARKEKLLIEEKDEFDMMDGNQKTLADRLGTSPEDIEKKMNAKRKEVKQRKPRKESSSRSPKKKGKGKNPWETDSEVEDEELSSEDDGVSRPPPRTTSRRTAAANIKFKYDSDDEEDDDEFELHDNSLENGGHVPVHDANLDTVKSKTLDISDTDSEFEMKNGSNKHPLSDSDDDFTSKRKPRPLKEVSSDAMFDSLISGSGTGEGIVKTAAAVLSSEEDAPPVPQKKQEALKKTTLFKSSTHESKPKKAPKKAAPKKRNVSDSDEDMFAVSKKKKSKKKVSSDEDDDEDDGYVPPPRSSASGRARKPVKYNFGDEDDDDDDDD
ncbi:hypothetical protein B7P43_G17195 [Cryptotermes secundus]|nr:hypothetical protein B7P43_G17195 [Cryptotermes secundus]